MRIACGLLLLAALPVFADVSLPGPRRTGQLRVAVLTAGGTPQKCVARLKRVIPKAEVEAIPIEVLHKGLRNFDLLVFPSEWTNKWNPILGRVDEIRRFIRRGGALLMFQPNPYRFANETLKVDLLPFTFTVNNRYSDNNTEIVTRHPVVNGLEGADLPFPCDRITECDPPWQVLVKGIPSGHASLIVARFGRGRVAVDADNHTRDRERHRFHSDRFLLRLILWLTRR
jgi:hypothetical protein